jgi:hypothetical protein
MSRKRGGYFAERGKDAAAIPYADVWNHIHRGSFPELCANPDFDWQMFFCSESGLSL